MNQPLGAAVGNSVEVKECIELLRGEKPHGAEPVLDLSVELAGHMLVLANVADSVDDAKRQLRKALDSGAALERFQANVEAQGGDPRVCDNPAGVLPLVTQSFHVESPRSGFVSSINTSEIGHAIAAIGGGRVRIEDAIDPSVGFMAAVKIGTKVDRGDALGTVYCGDEAAARAAVERIRNAYSITEEPLANVPHLIREVINE